MATKQSRKGAKIPMFRRSVESFLLFTATTFMLAEIGDFQTTIRGLYPPVTELSKFMPVKASSTCGLDNRPMRYCESSINNQSLTTCTQLECLLDCCETCGKARPASLGISNGTEFSVARSTDTPPSSSGVSQSKSFGSGSYIVYATLPASNVPLHGFSVCAWIKQSVGNDGALVVKGSSYTFIIKQYDIDIIYTTKDAISVVRNLTLKNVNLVQGTWQHVSFVIYNRQISVFANGLIWRTAVLGGVINDVTTDIRVGQRPDGSSQFLGLLQDVKYFEKAITNREVIEAMTGTMPNVYGYSYCRCPPSHPRISLTNPLYCIENGIASSSASPVSRLSAKSHPPEYLVNGGVIKPWISQMVENATVEIDLVYKELQIFQVQIMFYSPPARGIKIERSVNGGKTYTPWQYFADDCRKMFGLIDNGPLTEPDSVNCLKITSPIRSDFETLSFQTQEPGPENKPQRPIGAAGCKDFHCSPKLLQFVKATNVKISFYQHLLVTNPLHQYFGVRRILVSGTCDCYGHGSSCTRYASNSTHNASYVCSCDPRTFTEGAQCQRCKPLYVDKPFKRGMVLNAFPCKECQCNNHAVSCIYNRSLDANPDDRNILGGGVCENCQHNTAGRFCQTCKIKYYRPNGKALNAIDVCAPCNCVGDGVALQNSDCQRDGTNSSVLAGQCPCKRYAEGRQCTKCKNGYYFLTSGNRDGCISCECNPAGIANGNISCSILTGQCSCKTNVITLKCSRCRSGFYALSRSNPEGCSACNCDPWGSTGTVCDDKTGQCPCKSSTQDRRCHQCKDGFHSLTATGCQQCRCNADGTDPALLNLCNKTNGHCSCRQHVEGILCDRCKTGTYNLSRAHITGCLPCNCDSKGTVGHAGQCNALNGTCSCKALVSGKECNSCKVGTFNLTAANPDGCTRCNCYPKGTVNGDRISQDVLPCFSNGQCGCLSNVFGSRCDRCRSGYYWNPVGLGCISCNCNLQGSVNQACNATGYCNCKPGNGVGGLKCDQCLPGYYSFISGRCTSCGCSIAGSFVQSCDSTGTCLRCKPNVQGTKCDHCKPGTSNMQASNPFGCSGPPSEQGPAVISNITSRSMIASWFQPDRPNGLILRYELYRNNTLVYNSTRRSFRNTGLIPYTLYSYYIITHTDGGSTRSVDSHKVYRTLSDIPESVMPPVLSNVLARSMDVTWQPPIYPNGLIVRYSLSSTNTRSAIPTQHYQGLDMSYLVTGLRPFVVYNFTLTACTVIGCAQSTPVVRATRSTAPESQPAPYLRALAGGQAVYVYWDPPAEPNGVIQFYDLFMRQSPFAGPGTTQATKLNPTQRNFTVHDLRPYTEYEFRVVSYTSQVKGDTTSTWTRVTTLENVPSGEEYISPRIGSLSSRSANVTWYMPRYPNGIITRYEVYRYEQTDLSKPILSTSSLGTMLYALVTVLQPYSSYQFSVRACNAIGCTGYSSRVTTQTLPDAPSNQGPPKVNALNGSSTNVTWDLPTILNGPLPIRFQVQRTVAAFSHLPPQVEAGVRFSSFGYYKLPAAVIQDSAETRLEFEIRTSFSEGLIFYAASAFQLDMFAIEIRNGKPWFLFDTETGPASFTIASSLRIDDGKWHNIVATRNRRQGTITVDTIHGGNGFGGGSANVIGQISSVFVGGLPKGYRILRSDTGNAVLQRSYYIGCMKKMKYKGITIDFQANLVSSNVDPLYSHCPVDVSPGIHLKGGGYLTLPSGNFVGGSMFVLQLWLRTTYKTGLIMFAHGAGSTAIAVTINNGNITMFYQSPTKTGQHTAPFSQLCDGKWHNVTITGFSALSTIHIDNISHIFAQIPSDAVVNSNVYFGGVPSSSEAALRLKTLVKAEKISFGGCMRDVAFQRKVIIQRDVLESKNVAFDGCPANFESSSFVMTCKEPVISLVNEASSTAVTDVGLWPFTDYLYRIRSYRSGIASYATSDWISVRTKEGAPRELLAPVVSSIEARQITVTWSPPTISGGLLTKYQIQAMPILARSPIPKIADLTDISLKTYNLTSLDPYTTYNVSVKAYTVGGSIKSGHVRIVTLEAKPELFQPPKAVGYPSSLYVTWTAPMKPNGVILFYQLEVNDTVRYSGAGFNANITGLQVYTRYKLRLQAANKIGIVTVETHAYTGQLPPGDISAPQLRVLGSRRFDVTWRAPGVLNGVISKYEVLVATADIPSQYTVAYTGNGNIFHTTIATLIPGTLYYVRIAASTGGGRTIGAVATARTFESAPEDVLSPLLLPVSASTINVTIQMPLKPNGVVLYYVLFQDGLPVQNGSVLFYQGKGFRPYSRHTYRTRACTAKGCGESDAVAVYTLDSQPIGNVTLTARITGPRSFTARWTAVQIPHGIIRYTVTVTGEFYIDRDSLGMPVTYRTSNESKIAYNGSLVNTDVNYNGLLPYSFYSVQVNASNRAGYILSNIVAFPTPRAPPDGVLQPLIVAINSTALNVTWSEPGRANGIITSYMVIGFLFGSQDSSFRQRALGSGLQFFRIVSGLQPYKNYSFKVVVNGTGGISESAWKNITTPEDIPEGMDRPKIINIESRSVTVEISTPAKPNGVIIHYILFVNGTEMNRTLMTRFEVGKLRPFSFYVARVNACTVIGCRMSEESNVFQTLQDVPAGLQAPILVANSSRSVTVSWLEPLVSNGVILSYEIQRKQLGEIRTVIVAKVNATSSPRIFVDRTVKPWTNYQFRVIARTIAGGTPGPYSAVKTPEGDPEGIAAPSVVGVTSSSVLIQWTRPTIPNGHVTHYLIKAAGRQELVNRTTSLSFNLTGLGSYIEYKVIVSACTIGGCGDSPSRTVRTLTSFPSGQPAPTAEKVSATVLKVRWSLPSHPNGPIISFKLSRRTLEDLVSGNSSVGARYPTDWITVYDGSSQVFDDHGLGIYSLQQYKVMAITTIGNTTSASSNAFRTGAAPPLQGVNLTASAIDHATVALQWTLPPIQLLRGPSVRFDITYELVGGPVFVFKSLSSNETGTKVGNLRPSTAYLFKVSIFNGAGSKDSSKATARTLDGAPEGFDAPVLYVVSATSIRVSWKAPRTPNGVINNFTIVGNSRSYDTVSGTTYNHVQENLKPYTVYMIQVRVCTRYSCTISRGVSARTNPAAPGLIMPPKLEPLSSSSIRVLWATPIEPNGIMIGYQLFRRSVYNCPISPKPLTKCTYIRCDISEQNCNGICYNPATQICCNGTLHQRHATKSCCGTSYIRKTTPTDVCCGAQFYTQHSSYQCCHGLYTRVPAGSVCCKGQNGVLVGLGDTCCGDVPFNINGSKTCICQALYDRFPAVRKCCGGRAVAITQHCCGDEKVGVAYDYDSRKICCGSSYVQANTSLCCQNSIGQFRIHTHTNLAQKSNMKCCGTSQIPRTSLCCNNNSYNNASQVCSDKSSFGQTDCGTGLVCSKGQSSNAFCNSCSFDRSRLLCYSVPGFFDNSSIQTNSSANLCFTEYAELLKDRSNPGLLAFTDSGLLPHTLYDYFITGINSEGNSSSVSNRSRTLMARPEGLPRPQVSVLSASSIVVTWSAPATPNGIIQTYRLYRIEWQTKAEQLIFFGLSFSHTDSQDLQANTGYMYVISACTVLCSNQSAASLVYTAEAAPENVLAPSLRSLSPTSIQVNWTLPSKPNGKIIRYNVSRLIDGTYMSILPVGDLGLSLTHLVVRLRPYTLYAFRVIACTVVGCSTGPSASIRTLQSSPQDVHPPTLIIVNARTVDVSWVQPKVLNGILSRYSLLRNSIEIYSGKALNHRDTGLSPNSVYRYQIEAVTGGGSTRSTVALIATPESSPEGISAPTIKPISSSQLQVTWQVPSSPNGVITNYSLIYKDPTSDIFVKHVNLVNSYTIERLKPYTIYKIRVKACTVKGCGTGNWAESRTNESAPVGQAPPSLTVKSSSIITVTWQLPSNPNGIIARYMLTRKEQNIALMYKIYIGDAFEYIDTGLKPYTVYEYKIRSENGAGATESSWTSARTGSSVPQGLSAPFVTVINGISIRISWLPPTKPNGLITSYEIRVRVFGSSNSEIVARCCIPANNRNVSVTGLMPATTYEFRVAARTSGGTGFSGWTVARTNEARPANISSLRSNTNPDNLGDGKSMQVLWNPPANPNGVITNYFLYLDNYVVYQGLNRQTIIKRLNPFTNYTFQLEVCNSAGCSKGNAQILITAEVAPKSQRPPVFGAINATSITLTWRPPDSPNGIISRYNVYRRKAASARRRRQASMTIVYTTNDTRKSSYSFTDSGLSPYSTYQYKLRTMNSKGFVDSDWATVKTAAAAPAGFVVPNATASGAYSVSLTWIVPQSPNGEIQFYEVFRNSIKIETLTTLFYTDTSLKPVTLYRYTVKVCTIGGCTMSDVVSVTTHAAAPGEMQPPTLVALGAYRIQVTWSAPAVPNGQISKYQLRFSNNKQPVFEGLATTYIVSGLNPYTSYSLTISACTSSGCGKHSIPANTRTLSAVPQDLSPPSLFVLGPTTIEATWKQPKTPNGVILFCTLQRDSTVVYNGTDLRFVDRTVAPGTRYWYIVSCKNKAGTVTSQPQYSATTNPSAPENVSKPSLRPTSFSSIEVTWVAPKKPNGAILKYYVLFGGREVDAGNSLSYMARDLKYYTMYEFRISACTSAGCTSGPSASARTSEAKPANQSVPIFNSANIGSRYIVVEWLPPQNPNGVIRHYELRRRSNAIVSKLIYTGPRRIFNDTSTDIQPNTRYEYQVMSFNGAGSTSSLWAPITTTIDLPQQVKIVSVLQQDIKSNSFVFSVEEPLQPNGQILSYIVELLGIRNITLVSAKTGSATGLVAYTEYRLRMYACNAAGCTRGPVSTIRTASSFPTGFANPPVIAAKSSRSVSLRWTAPTSLNGPSVWYEVNERYICPQSSIAPPLCIARKANYNATTKTDFTVSGLLPAVSYFYKITVYNNAGHAVSPEVSVITISENPVVLRAPNATVIRNSITIDWTTSFDLRSPLEEYILEENLIQAYTGNKLSVTRPNREVGAYGYVVRAKTIVNGKEVTVTTPLVSVNVGDVATTNAPTAASQVWYTNVWFLSIVVFVAAILILVLVVLIHRKCIGKGNVYIRERDPLPVRPKSKMSSRTGSQSSLGVASEKRFPYLGTPTPSRQEILAMTPNLYSSRHDLIDNSQMDSTPLNDKVSFLGPDEPSWDTYLKGFGSNGKDRDSGLFDDPSPIPDDESSPYESIQKERILFPDTHL